MDFSKTLSVFVLMLLHWCRQCYTQENAPLYMYATSDDLRQAFGISADRIDLVSDGRLVVNSLATPETAQILTISWATAVIPVVILSCTENMSVNFTWTSMNTSILKNPMMSIPLSFTFPKCSYRLFILFSCARVSADNVIVSKLTINAYTKEKSYNPVEFYLLKTCGRNSLEITNVTEYLADANDTFEGCFSDTDPPVKPSAAATVVVESSSNASPGIIAVAVILPIAVLTVIVVTTTIFLVWYFRRRSRKLARANFTIEMMSTLYQVDNPLFDRVEALKPNGPHEKEFPLKSVTCVRELGEGAFGRVYQGTAKNIIVGEDTTTVAVKQLKVNTFEDDGIVVGEFFKEVTFMSKLDHPRILKLLGVCSVTEPYCMIFEYMDLGSLNSYLRSAIGLGPDCDEALNKETCFLQLSDLLSIVEQIAEGMEYLSNQNLVHRDLATRNCLVATGPTVKISDFGLSRDVSSTDYYRVRGRAVLPIRWMAPEAIVYGKFTTATDVWSFGVVVWEVFTYGQQPYVGMTNEEVVKFVTKQGTLEPPSGCPQKVANIMMQCWSQSPGSRPSFSKLLTTIRQLPSVLLQTHHTTSCSPYPSL